MNKRIKEVKFKIICGVLITLIISFASISSTFGYEDDQYVEAIVFFEPNESVEVSSVEYIYRWDSLNAFYGRMPCSTYEFLITFSEVHYNRNKRRRIYAT